MKTHPSIQISIALLALAITSPSVAGVQFRISHDASSKEYVVYMTPDTVPSPDMVLSSQVTLRVPHGIDKTRFNIDTLTSAVTGIHWVNHSRVDAPVESPDADYLSFGLLYSGGKPPPFDWQAGKEKRIFSFKSAVGCVAGVTLIDNHDPFSQLPNSANTNPGNEFSNIGWLGGNSYTGNYGKPITCGNVPTPLSICEKNPLLLSAIKREVSVLAALINKIGSISQRQTLQKKLNDLRSSLQCN
ncbi:MAG: hypothetical protein RL122_2008 [Pseudomonadota bacterium]|jgi:hypothetical protein